MTKMSYLEYHARSELFQDIDPAYPMLRYICNRFELNLEQRYWLAFLYATCYCGPTVYYMYNEFPDFENVNSGRLQRWWKSNKSRCIFQTDRRRIQSNDQFVDCFLSYRNLIVENQVEAFRACYNSNQIVAYRTAYHKFFTGIKYFGRFTMFLYLECVRELTAFPMVPDTVDWRNAETCAIGLVRAFNLPDRAAKDTMLVQNLFEAIRRDMQVYYPKSTHSVWAMETTLCAYKKYLEDRRYIGYYVNRQLQEIEQMERNVTEGVCWKVLYDFRAEYFFENSLEAAKCER